VPDLLDSDEHGQCVVLVSSAFRDDQITVTRNAVLNCPEQAIELVEE